MKTSVWFSWVIFAVAIVALCVAIVRCEPIKADWVSIDIGILAALATCLVGWQIYSLIELNDIRKNYKRIKIKFLDLKQNLDSNSRILNAESTMLHGAHYITWYNIGRDESALGTAYFMLTHALRNYALERKRDFVGKCLELMQDCVCITHNNNVWDKAFSDEVDRLAEQDFKVIFKLIGYFTPEQAVLFHQIRQSRLNKKLCEELLAKCPNSQTQAHSEGIKTTKVNHNKKGKKK